MSKSIEKRFSHAAKGLFFLAGAIFLVWMIFQPSWFKNVKAEVTSQPYARTISVSGEGEVTSKPDVAVVNLAVVSQGGSVKVVTEDGNKKMGQIVDVVKKLGVSEDDIKTTSYNLYPEYAYPENRKAVIAGYNLNQNVQVKVRDLTKVEDVLDQGVAAGSNQVGQISFEIDDDSIQRNEARDEAFADARKKAESMAGAAGVKVGRVITFSESGDFAQPYYARAEMVSYDMEGVTSAPSIEPGSQETKITVNVTYEIE